MTGVAVSSSMYKRRASSAEALVAALVDESPFSTSGVIVLLRVLVEIQ